MRDLWTLRLSKLLHELEDPLEGDNNHNQGSLSGINSQDENGDEKEVRTKRTATGSPYLIDTICLCYMAMLLIRLPIGLGQILQWIHEEDLPYIRAIRHVPAEMRDKLPGEYHEALDTSIILRPEILQAGVMNLCAIYSQTYGMEISPLNSIPMLYEYVKSLSLPLEVYRAAQNLNDILKFDFKYAASNGSRRKVILYPEAQLMSLVVIGTKLLFPFDDKVLPRHPRNAAEDAMLLVDWNTWADTRKARRDTREQNLLLENGKEINVNDTNVFSMSAHQLDQYMDWYQRTWARSRISNDDLNKELLDMFPLQQIPEKHVDSGKALCEEEIRLKQVKAVQASLKTSETATEEQVAENLGLLPKPGMRYQQFRDKRALSLSVTALSFHLEAAELSCLSLDMLLRAVLQTERKITLWRRAKRRAEKFGENVNLEAEGVMPTGLEGLDQLTLVEAAIDPEKTTLDTQEADPDSDDIDANMRMFE